MRFVSLWVRELIVFLSQTVLEVVTLIRLEAYKAYYAPLKQYARQLTICRSDRRKSIVWTKPPTTQKLKN